MRTTQRTRFAAVLAVVVLAAATPLPATSAGSDDAFEDNDACGTPWALGTGTYPGLIVESLDEDWFSLSSGVNEHINIRASFQHASGDIDMRLFTACGTQVGSSEGVGNTEGIYYLNTTGAVLRLRIYLYAGTRNEYALAIGPNLNATVTPSGWSWPIVPRSTGDATNANAVLSPALDGDVTNTWLNWAELHEGPGLIGQRWDSHVYLDWEQLFVFTFALENNGPGSYQLMNYGPRTVPGGRHSFTNYVDPQNWVPESNENDNAWAGQYVWSPTPLANHANAIRGPAPHQGFYTFLNQDGYSGAGDYWGAFGIIPQGTDDADLYLYNDYAGSLTGFQTPLVGSTAGGQSSDFVIWNNNWLGFGASRQAGVVRYSGGTSNYVIHHTNEVSSVNSLPTAYGTSYVTPVTTMGANDVVKLHEVFLDPTSGLHYTFTMENLSGSASLNVTLYDRAGSHFSKFDWIALGTSGGPGGNATFNYQPSASGWYVVAVWKTGAADVGLANDYQLRIGPALSNLSENIAPPAGWDDVIAPRNDVTGIPTVSATLDGNAINTWVTWAIGQLGPNPMPAWNTEAWLDEEPWSGVFAAGAGSPPGTYMVPNAGPFYSRGGRHTVIAFADRLNTVAESDEGDNRHDRQLIWSPLSISAGTPIFRLAPPHVGYGPWYNADGLHYARNPSFAWIVSAAPALPSDDFDLWMATDYASSTSGYSIFPAYSLWGGNNTDYVVGHFSGTPNDLYPEITRSFLNTGVAGVAVDANTSLGHFGLVGAAWLGQSMAAGRLADVYELYLDSGNTVHITLRRQSGTGDLGFELFSGAAGTMGGRGWGTTATQLVGHLAELTYTASVSGWHPIAVFRHNGTDSGTPLTYDLVTSATALVDVVDAPETTELLFAGARPNPVRDGTRFAYSLPQAGTVRLALYDLSGRRVRMIVDGMRSAGSHNEAWDGRGDDGGPLSSGLYWARFEAGGRSFTRRVSLLR